MRIGGIACLFAGLLGACSPAGVSRSGFLTGEAWDIETVAALPAAKDPYFAALQEGYVTLARKELDAFDWNDGAFFTALAKDAAAGTYIGPNDPSTRSVDGEEAQALDKAFKVMTAYSRNPGGLLRAGRQIGEAQVQFDCWVEEAEEGADPQAVESCRETYALLIQLVRDLAGLPKDMAVVLPKDSGEVGGIVLSQKGKEVLLDKAYAAAGTGEKLGDVPVLEAEIKEAFAGALAAQPKPPVLFELTFGFNKTRVSDQGFEQILAIVAEVRSRDAAEVLVTGYADAPGDSQINLALSRSRAANVQDAIDKELRDGESPAYSIGAKGEKDLAIDTRTQEQGNRRVLVLVR